MLGVLVVAQQMKNLSSIHEVEGLIPGLAQWVKHLVLLCLWCRLAAAAPIRPLAWALPYARRRQKKFFFGLVLIPFRTGL